MLPIGLKLGPLYDLLLVSVSQDEAVRMQIIRSAEKEIRVGSWIYFHNSYLYNGQEASQCLKNHQRQKELPPQSPACSSIIAYIIY